MDIKIRFTKRTSAVIGAVLLCGLIGWGCWQNSDFKARRDIKATCKSNCVCFSNVVDYRLTDAQVRMFTRFINELQRRPTANVLEFMSQMDAVALQQAFAVCQPQPPRAAKAVENTQPQKK